MAARWYCSRDSKEIGPFAWQQVKQMAESGLISRDDLLKSDDHPQWRPAHTCKGLSPEAAAKTTPAAAPPMAKPVKARVAAPPVAESPLEEPPIATPPVVAPPVQRTAKVAPVTPVVKKVKVPVGGIPVGKTVAASSIPVGTVAKPPISFSKDSSPTSHTSPYAKPKKSGSMNLLLIGGGVALVLVGVFIYVLNQPKPSQEIAHATTPATKPKGDEKPVSLVDAEAAAAALTKSPAAESTTPSSEKSAFGKDPVAQAVKSWNPASKEVSLRGAGVAVKIERVWPVANETGREMPTEALETSSGDPPMYLCVQLLVTCTASDKPLLYQGWSEGAVLVNGEGQTIAPVEPSATPAISRIRKMTIRPGDASEDILVFPWVENATKFKLALPHKNLGIKSTGVFGFDLSRIDEKEKPLAAKSPAGNTVASDAGETTGDEMKEEDDMPAKPDAKPKSEVDEVDDLVKRLEKEAKEADKAEAEMKMKLEAEAMKKNMPEDAKQE